MRKIENKSDLEKKQSRRNMWLSLFMLALLLFSSAGYAFISGDKTSSKTNNLDSNQILVGQTVVALSNSRLQTQNVSININKDLSDFLARTYVDDGSEIVPYEIMATIGQVSEKIQPACYGNCSRNLPEKTCNDLIIVWNKTSDENKVTQNQNCIFIDGDQRAVDAFLYRIFNQ
jgi:hypothetical protein